MLGIKVKNFGISFGKTKILENVSFDVQAGEIVTILGPSGSGKSTILRSIASLQDNFEGEIFLNETCLISQTNSCNSDIGYIFQDYALFPHLNVKDNIGFALTKFSKNQKSKRVEELLEQFDLLKHQNKQIHELSGGQQQRVSIARTIAYNPKILLLDEPFANLDSILRNKTKLWLKKTIKKLGLSAILVTHDKKEALSISDKIGIIHNKTLIQFGTPQELFFYPKNLYVANFLGNINIIPKELASKLGKNLKDDETPIVRVSQSFVNYEKNGIELILIETSFCGDHYELSLFCKDFPSYVIEINTNYLPDPSKKIYLNLQQKDIQIVATK